jgi:hypothetical protein
MVTSLGANRPTRAGAPTLNLLISSFTCRQEGQAQQQYSQHNHAYWAFRQFQGCE